MALLPAVERLIDLAIEEDLGRGDATSEALVDENRQARAGLVAKQGLVVSGLDVAARVFERVDPRIEVTILAQPGADVVEGTAVLSVRGPARGILAAERTALNFVQRLSGVATLTRRFVEAVRGT